MRPTDVALVPSTATLMQPQYAPYVAQSMCNINSVVNQGDNRKSISALSSVSFRQPISGTRIIPSHRHCTRIADRKRPQLSPFYFCSDGESRATTRCYNHNCLGDAQCRAIDPYRTSHHYWILSRRCVVDRLRWCAFSVARLSSPAICCCSSPTTAGDANPIADRLSSADLAT